jgi:membrane-associated phospholipid phosphatase
MKPAPWQRLREEAIAIPWDAQRQPVSAEAHVTTLASEFRRTLLAAWNACGAFEWVALGYLALSFMLILIWRHNLAHPSALVATQAFVAAIILVLCRIEARSAARAAQTGGRWAHGFWHFWRHWYPHLFFLFCFEELGRLVHLVYPGWFDARLIAFDCRLTGVHPSIWLEQFASPSLNDFMQFAYITYFLYLVVLGGVLYWRKDWEAYWSVMTYSAAGYAIGYVISLFFPIESPWFAMAGAWHAELKGGFITTFINTIEHFGRVHGAAFPSEHVAGSVAALWGAWRHRRRLFWVFLPLAALMCVSTVYGRYHYVADVFAGTVTGTLGYWIGSRLMRVRGAVAGMPFHCSPACVLHPFGWASRTPPAVTHAVSGDAQEQVFGKGPDNQLHSYR